MHSSAQKDAVTGAFGYTGKYIAAHLLAAGHQVITLTRRPQSASPFGQRVTAYPFDAHDPAALRAALQGVDTLYNTHWVRFSRGEATFAKAIKNTQVLLHAAKDVGLRRFVHISVTNPDLDSPLPYFRGKAQVEELVQQSGLSYAILRPALIFGREDILLNNISWLLRRFPVFAVPGDGEYKLRPIYAQDLAVLAKEVAVSTDDLLLDAVGPETYTFNELLNLLAEAVGRPSRLLHVPSELALRASQLLGWALGDVLLTRDELSGLMDNFLLSEQPPSGKTKLSEWALENANSLGVEYAHELQKHYGDVAGEPELGKS